MILSLLGSSSVALLKKKKMVFLHPLFLQGRCISAPFILVYLGLNIMYHQEKDKSHVC